MKGADKLVAILPHWGPDLSWQIGAEMCKLCLLAPGREVADILVLPLTSIDACMMLIDYRPEAEVLELT